MKTTLCIANMACMVVCTMAGLLRCSPVEAQPASAPLSFSMPEQPLRDALNGLARQTGLQVIYTAEEVTASLLAPKIEGQFTPEAALNLLLQGSGLHFEFINSRTVAVSQTAPGPSSGASAGRNIGKRDDLRSGAYTAPTAAKFTLARAGTIASEAGEPPATAAGPGRDNGEARDAQTVVVTGSHIRGAQSSASPMLVFDREDIQQSGFTSTQQFIESLPQNFRGGTSEYTMGGILGGEGSNLNYGSASGANLRGLGNKATLTLLNGRRVSRVGVGEAVDLSMIPLAAIERIDVLTDGASAIYGSDAVGGVINIILRDRYAGAETSLRYGDVTDGSNEEYKVGQTLGGDWGSGSALVGYEYARRYPLSALEREFTRDGTLIGLEIVPPNEQHSAVAALSQRLTDRVEILGEALFSTRKTESAYSSFGNEIRSPRAGEQYGGGVGVRLDIGSDWQADIGTGYSNNHTDYAAFQNGIRVVTVDMESGVWSLDAKADGGWFAAPGGQARLAVGAHHRRETFESRGTSSNTAGEDARDVSAVFSELLIPLVGRGNARAGVQRLEISIAGRYENYSDVGSTANPKVGLAWSPVPGLNLRGTYGTSFRAPSFYESSTNASPLRPIAYAIPDPQSTAPSGTTTTIALYGNTGMLRSEEADSWTAGLDFRPELVPGLALSLTYFDIDFTDRIAEPLITGFFDMLVNEAQHPDFIDRNPDPAVVAAYLASPGFLNFSGAPATVGNVGVIADNRRVNVSSVQESGLDFSLSYGLTVGADRFAFQISGAYLFEKLNQATSASPQVNTYNAVFYPVDLRLRNSVGWSRGAFGATLFLNYVDSYQDVRPGRESMISSWSTADLTARYQFIGSQSWLRGVTLSLVALNVLDKAPPLIINNGFNFDATNASGIGRHLSIGLTKEW